MAVRNNVMIARDTGLEARIAEDRNALEPYLIYADFLQERGDPRGELITIQIAMETADVATRATLRIREIELLRDHLDYLRGPLLVNGVATHHRRGFVERIDVWSSTGMYEVLDALAIDHPATRFVHHLRCGFAEEDLPRIRARLAKLGRDCRVTPF